MQKPSKKKGDSLIYLSLRKFKDHLNGIAFAFSVSSSSSSISFNPGVFTLTSRSFRSINVRRLYSLQARRKSPLPKRFSPSSDLHRLIQLFEYRCETFDDFGKNSMIFNCRKSKYDQHEKIRKVETIDFHAEKSHEERKKNKNEGIFPSIFDFNSLKFLSRLANRSIGL